VHPEPTLPAWLAYLETLHPSAIDLGLERVDWVRSQLGLSLSCPVITVGGTNGKGSTCALLESILHCAGFRVGCYTSPHLVRYNERIRIARTQASDAALVRAFTQIEAARRQISLTYFEFGTLAAALLFRDACVDVAVLEVGLGGRLDAVNVFDPDCAVVTSIGLDHMEYLGESRAQIALEKAGIFRPQRPAVVGDPEPPATLLQHAQRIGAQLHLIDRDFGAHAGDVQWTYWSTGRRRSGLPWPALRGAHQLENATTALAALESVRERLPVDGGAIRRGLIEVELAGRFQVLAGRPVVVLDVAHNPHAARRLRTALACMGRFSGTFAVFAMLRDKDIAGVARELAPLVDRWFLAPLAGPRGATVTDLQAALSAARVMAEREALGSVAQAYARAREEATADDRIIVFGSFHTVGEVLTALEAQPRA
jgi:dihydrofolate synthase/folylpolyglutamate synthase